MKILITNDDGVEAAQLIPLIRRCREFGDVTVVVPLQEQSAKSHSIEIRKAFRIFQRQIAPDIRVWTVDSTPADCVRFACSGLKQKYDLVISGINRGFNLGRDTMYSGTVAAATEAVNKGMHAVAISTSVKYYDRAVSHLGQILDYLKEQRRFDRCGLYNVNIPVDPQGIRITCLGGESFREEFIPQEDGFYFPGGEPVRADGSNPRLDTHATVLGYISITPMTTDRTDFSVFRELTEDSRQ